ncbi:MAG: hypothetical protein ACRDD7_08305 [Peptostreptococcaceae bacterium]
MTCKKRSTDDYKVESKLLELALSGDVEAIIFWLTNRFPDKWKDHRNINISAETIIRNEVFNNEG